MKKETLALLLVLLLCGCGNLEEARTAGMTERGRRPVGASTNPSHLHAYCRKLNNQRTTWGAVAAAMGVASGSSGVTSIPLENEDAKLVAQSVAVGTLAIGGAAYIVQNAKEQAWARECSER